MPSTDSGNEIDLTKKVDELEWANLMDSLQEIGQQEGQFDKLKRKIKENPFIPFGALLTTACLTLGLINMAAGNSKRQQFFMRGRVIAQSFTIICVSAGMYYAVIDQEKGILPKSRYVKSEESK